jgi:hypothetical protein
VVVKERSEESAKRDDGGVVDRGLTSKSLAQFVA